MPMKILFSGGTGLLGSELGQALAKNGHQLLVLTRDKEKAASRKLFPCEFLNWDQLPSAKDLLSDVNALIHLAGEGIADQRWTGGRKQVLYDSRIKTALAAVHALQTSEAPIDTVITASATGIYGDRGDEVLTENSATGNDFASKLCLDWEAATRGAFTNSRWVALRTAPVLSPNGGFLGRVLPIFAILALEIGLRPAVLQLDPRSRLHSFGRFQSGKCQGARPPECDGRNASSKFGMDGFAGAALAYVPEFTGAEDGVSDSIRRTR